MTAASPTPQPSRWRSLKVALLISIALNLLLAGAIAGWLTQRHWHARGDLGGDRLVGALPREAREEMRRSLKEKDGDFDRKLGALREARREAREAMAAEPFDAARLAAAMATVRSRNLAVQEDVHAAMVDATGNLAPEARRKLAEWRRSDRRDADRR